MIKANTKYGIMKMAVGERYRKEHEEMLFERPSLDIVEAGGYDVFIDIGAAWGYFSIPASYHCKTVQAFEPHYERRKLLQENKIHLDRKNILISGMAIGTGNKTLYANSEGKGMLGPKSDKRTKRIEVVYVPLQTVLGMPGNRKFLVKIDVEGNELDVIKSLNFPMDKVQELWNISFLIERHNLVVSEKELFDAMKPYKGTLLGTRKNTSHYLFMEL